MITSERLKELLEYEPKTGIFRWKIETRQTKIGSIAAIGGSHPYVRIRLDGAAYYAHRLAWLYVHGEWPIGDLDHIDEDKRNNRISNLRLATESQNQHNKSYASKNSKTGLIGSSLHKASGLYRASIQVYGVQTDLGYFKTAEEAHEAYVKAKRKLHPFWVPKGHERTS